MEKTSAACAAALLSAWQTGDAVSLSRHLDSTLNTPIATDLCELERERHELVSGIAETMRDALAKSSGAIAGCDIEIPLKLLRHVVATPTQ
jgi:hypothetical protein